MSHSSSNRSHPSEPPDSSWLCTSEHANLHIEWTRHVYALTDSAQANRISKNEGEVYGDGPFHIKIGSSRDPVKRRAQLQPTGGRYTLLWVSRPVYSATWAEMWLHYIYRDDWVRGDWFSLGPRGLCAVPEWFEYVFDEYFEEALEEWRAREEKSIKSRRHLAAEVPGIEGTIWCPTIREVFVYE